MARKRRRKDREEVHDEPQAGAASASASERLTPVDVQQKVFRLAFRGYREGDVDEFLDLVTESLAAVHEENKRLREQLHEGGRGAGSPGAGAEAREQAEAIVRQAREHAARLVADAEQRAGSGAPGGAPAPASFLVRERAFLQRLAGLVQEHARTLKEEARKGRPAPTEGGGGGAVAAPSEPQAPPRPQEVAGEPANTPTAARALEEPEDTGVRPVDPERAEAHSAGEEDPLLSAWENAFMSGADEGGLPGQAVIPAEGEGEGSDEEPSLRELFWGEE